MRTDDTSYGADYWNTLDGGAGYQDSVMWEDLAVIVKEVFFHTDRDHTGELNLLDMGCAHGFLVRHLRRRGVEAWGADYSQYAIDHAPSDTSQFLRQYDLTADVEVGTLAGHPFDLVTCFETMEHIPEESVQRALFWIKHALKPGGRALLTICTSAQPGWDSDPTHVTIKPRTWWERQFALAGLPVDDLTTMQIKKFHLFREHDGVFVVNRP